MLSCLAGRAKKLPCSQQGKEKTSLQPFERMPRVAAWSALAARAAALAAELGGSTVPSAVQMLLFQQCREETIQGNDYYIILKEYGFEKTEEPRGALSGSFSFFLFFNKLQKQQHCPMLPQTAIPKAARGSSREG